MSQHIMNRYTARERQVLDLTGQGLTSSQIAATLGASELTIRKHRSNIMRKAGLTSTAQLIAYARGTTAPQVPPPPLAWDVLAPREAEVVRYVAAGLTSKEIARLIDISPRTVQKHRERAREKLGVHTLQEIIIRGRSHADLRCANQPGLPQECSSI
ncbi:response regulator transcription factor [Nitrospirillum sp. BR 11163]|uniref:response regulator transcription factor n=1 Tax=Nitrospirillum sp. BR 11163 TaxID=3104323 RepID=UPI002AFE221D|nr:LuxR C-terminal-related transcriptional regulator [Nitrospirillum sp. BR 11163]MEA1672739.1 LuxR C-terminal-related transcriptional regulator [Nitrospirillum sp. BR 11163]